MAYHVSRKSDIFFSTLTSQQELQDQISQTRQQVTSLRQKLGSVDQITTYGLLKAVKLHATKSRHIQIYHKVELKQYQVPYSIKFWQVKKLIISYLIKN